ncbi:LPD7 domain-containing protein [Paraburkholderia youngii]|uniref:LPD7 domain-containing protein n=1 Tax=Paraburkholderia youngii TaxID=2782701 RepID=UPI001FECF489
MAVAQAKNWGELQVKGTDEFRRQAWIAAELAGIPTRGFRPDAQDRATPQSAPEAMRIAAGERDRMTMPRVPTRSRRRRARRSPTSRRLPAQMRHRKGLRGSLRRTAAIFALGYHTVRRWWRWLATQNENFSFHLRSRFASLGRSADRTGFWLACFQLMPLCEAMGWLDDDGVAVP